MKTDAEILKEWLKKNKPKKIKIKPGKKAEENKYKFNGCARKKKKS